MEKILIVMILLALISCKPEKPEKPPIPVKPYVIIHEATGMCLGKGNSAFTYVDSLGNRYETCAKAGQYKLGEIIN